MKKNYNQKPQKKLFGIKEEYINFQICFIWFYYYARNKLEGIVSYLAARVVWNWINWLHMRRSVWGKKPNAARTASSGRLGESVSMLETFFFLLISCSSTPPRPLYHPPSTTPHHQPTTLAPYRFLSLTHTNTLVLTEKKEKKLMTFYGVFPNFELVV